MLSALPAPYSSNVGELDEFSGALANSVTQPLTVGSVVNKGVDDEAGESVRSRFLSKVRISNIRGGGWYMGVFSMVPISLLDSCLFF